MTTPTRLTISTRLATAILNGDVEKIRELTTMTDPKFLTPERIAEYRKVHDRLLGAPNECLVCGEWPCPAYELLGHIAAVEKEFLQQTILKQKDAQLHELTQARRRSITTIAALREDLKKLQYRYETNYIASLDSDKELYDEIYRLKELNQDLTAKLATVQQKALDLAEKKA